MTVWDGKPRKKWTDEDAAKAVASTNQTMQALRYEAVARSCAEPGSDEAAVARQIIEEET